MTAKQKLTQELISNFLNLEVIKTKNYGYSFELYAMNSNPRIDDPVCKEIGFSSHEKAMKRAIFVAKESYPNKIWSAAKEMAIDYLRYVHQQQGNEK